MDLSGISGGLLQQVANSSSQNGDAVTISVLRKAMDIQASQAQQLIDSVKQTAPSADGQVGQMIDVRA